MTYSADEERPHTSVRDLQRRWGEVSDKALVEPVVITSNGRPRHVLMSMAEYERILSESRQAYWVGDLPGPMAVTLRQGLSELRVSDSFFDDADAIC